MGQYKIKTPHAAVIVWNYADRIRLPNGEFDATGVDSQDGIEETIISTLSCVSIQTSKSKGKPDGEFNLVLAPYRNWVSSLTAGSWCCILMSNKPITKESLKKANKDHVKMIGRIETVRCETQAGEDGERRTLYYVSGIDWGHIFNSALYIDNLISAGDVLDQRNLAALAIQNILFGKNGSPVPQGVTLNLTGLLAVMGKDLGKGLEEAGKEVGRLPSSVYEFKLPAKMLEFFNFVDLKGNKKADASINRLLNLQTGVLVDEDTYEDSNEAIGYVNPFSLQGTHTLWQILLENSNSTLNEMFCEMKWVDKGLQLVLFNRIKPFAYDQFENISFTNTPNSIKKDASVKSDLKSIRKSNGEIGGLISPFQWVQIHSLEDDEVISVNAGTNWRDKFNFIEIKPDFQEFAIFENCYKQKAQSFDREAFKREGFRPLIFNTKQFPSSALSKKKETNDIKIDWDQLEVWSKLLRKWYFNTHLTLNGTISIHGTTEYIAVGNNIRFSAGLLNPNTNLNAYSNQKKQNGYILAHVESVSHAFSVGQDGARSYRTVINFVRGISVDNNNNIKATEGGALDQTPALMGHKDDRNVRNVNSTSDVNDPDKLKNGGT
jgi:hypothetical protein